MEEGSRRGAQGYLAPGVAPGCISRRGIEARRAIADNVAATSRCELRALGQPASWPSPPVFPHPQRFREKIDALNQDAHVLYPGRDRKQTITPPASVSKPQRRKENKPRKHHEKCGQKRVPQLAVFLAWPCKQEGDERLCHPERRSDLADFGLRKARLCKQLPQSTRRKVKSMKWHMPVDPVPAEHRPQPALTVRAADPNLTATSQNSMDVPQHLARIRRVLQYV